MDALAPHQHLRRFLTIMLGALLGYYCQWFALIILYLARIKYRTLRANRLIWIALAIGIYWHNSDKENQRWFDNHHRQEQPFSCWVLNDATCREYKNGRYAWEFTAYDLRLGDSRHKVTLPVKASWYARPEESLHAPKAGEYWTGTGKARIWKNQIIFLSIPRHTGFATEPTERFGAIPAKVMATKIATFLRKRLSKGITNHTSEPVVAAIVLGIRDQLPRETYQQFRRAGMVHVLAVSGLHVGVACAFFYWVLGYLRISLRMRNLLCIPICICYTFITGLQPSAVRACLMAIIYLGARVFRRQNSILNALLLTGMVVWCLNWSMAWRPSWLLSFTVMFSLCTLFPLLRHCFELRTSRQKHLILPPVLVWARHWFSSDELFMDEQILRTLGKSAQPLYRLDIYLRRLTVRWFFNGLLVSLTAWLASLPLGLHFFGQVTLSGLLGNVFVVSLAGFVLISGLVSLLVGALVPPLQIPLNQLTNFLADGILWITKICDGLGLSYNVERTSVTFTILLYLLEFYGAWLLWKWATRYAPGGQKVDEILL